MLSPTVFREVRWIIIIIHEILADMAELPGQSDLDTGDRRFK